MRDVVALGLTFSLAVAVAVGCQKGQREGPTAAAILPASSTQPAASVLPAGGVSVAEPPQAEPLPSTIDTGQEAPVAASHIKLPRSPATPVRRSSRWLGRKQLDWLAAVTFPDFDHQERRAPPRFVEVRHVTQGRPRLGVTVTIGPCIPKTACPPMKLARWNARRDELLGLLPRELRSRPDTRFDIGARAIGGAPAIYTYQLGYSAGTDERDQPSIDYSDAYIVYYNDGINQIRVMANYLDDPVGGIDQLLAVAPAEDLEKLAVAFTSFYVHAWN